VQKSDGGYLYSTTDLAAIRHRSSDLARRRVLYFVDVRQSLHFRQIFAVAARPASRARIAGSSTIPFGTILGKDGRPFRSRDGGLIKLTELLDEGGGTRPSSGHREESGTARGERAAIARAVGIGAVKYADLSKNRTSDYVFDWDTMLSLEGNTGTLSAIRG